MRKPLFLIEAIVFGLFLAGFVFATPPNVPAGVEITLDKIISIASGITDFLYTVAGVLIGIVLVWTGIIWATAGGEPGKLKQAKDLFKAGLIGALIIFGAGAIIGTIGDFAADPGGFFDSSGSGGPPPGGPGGPPPPGTVGWGCTSGQCVQTSGGIYADSSCDGFCGYGGSTGQSFDCVACVDPNGGVSTGCPQSLQCVSDPNSCQSGESFTQIPEGC